MKKVLLLVSIGISLISCSTKEKLKGERTQIVLAEGDEITVLENDHTPVEIDKSVANSECVQPFYNASHYYAPLKLARDFKEIWNKNLDYESTPALRTAAAPIVAGGKLFCMDAGGVVHAIHAKTGTTIWRQSATIKGKDGQVGGALAYSDGLLIVNSSFSESMALDVNTGKVVWRIKLPAPAKGDAITIRDGKAFMLCADSTLCVVDTKTGKILWTHTGMISEANYIGSASVAVSDDVIYVVYPSGEVFALLMENGSVLWESMVSKSSLTSTGKTYLHPRACPVVKDNFLYIVAANGQTIAFDARNGNQLWANNNGSLQTPIMSGNSIFICNADSELVCLNRFSGRKKWTTKLDTEVKLISSWYGQLLIEDGILILSPYGRLMLIDPKNGKILKSMNLANSSDFVSLNPIVADGIMYIQLNSGKVIAYK